MLTEPKGIERLARLLCSQRGYDPNHLEPGNMCFHSNFDIQKYQNSDYEHLFDNDPSYAPDGHNGKDPCMFMWRHYVRDAVEILNFLKEGG